jgi:aminoglycoside/choline kinase family phosphotransferase
MKTRKDSLQEWLKHEVKLNIAQIDALAGDASFRKYYRLQATHTDLGSQSFIAMDAPPALEKNQEFLQINHILRDLNVHVPCIYASNLQDGFMLLEDFGNCHFFEKLTPENKSQFYQKAIDVIHHIQQPIEPNKIKDIPRFSIEHMQNEMALFERWFLKEHLNMELSSAEMTLLQKSIDYISEAIDKHPKTLIHRDYHSRNLMILSSNEIGVIDYQDAMIGPRTYDLVSLLKDCYIEHSEDFQAYGLHYFQHHTQESTELMHEFTLCGLQRHLKVLGIFARLFHRDDKPRYLNDLPLVVNYTVQALAKLPELSQFYDWFLARPFKLFQEKVSHDL